MPHVRSSLVLLALAAALLAFPLGALASHQFADVPDSNPFHTDISALVTSGVTSGCGGGNYCPSANVTRGQMAAFLNRLGALGAGKVPVVNATKVDGLDSSQFTRSDTEENYRLRCTAYDMMPAENYDYTIIGGELAFDTTSGAAGCQVHLPHDATITATTFRVRDVSAAFEVSSCFLAAYDFSGGETVITSSDGSGVSFDAGFVNLSGGPILDGFQTVNTTDYTYAMVCSTDGGGLGVSFATFMVHYNATGVPLVR